jgi:hypothetical protein
VALKDAMKQVAVSCKAGRNIASFTDNDIETLDEWISQRVSARKIVAAIRNEYPDQSFVEGTFLDHVRAECTCPDGTVLKGSYVNG